MLNIPKAVIKKDGLILLLKRVDYSKNFPGLWDLPGGKPDEGETIEETLIREVREETSYQISVSKNLGDYFGESLGRKIKFTVFDVNVTDGTLQISEDHSEFRWLSPSEILEIKTMPFMEPFLKDHHGI